MNIVSLKIKNFMGISDVEIKPGQINQIVGNNNQGKTTTLKAFEWAIEGGTDTSLIKNGETEAEVIVQLADETTIRRRLNETGKNTLDVKKGDFKVQSPQSYLDMLFEKASFNPMELLDPKKRHEAILNSIAIQLDEKSLAEMLEQGRTPGETKIELPPLDYSQHGLKVIDQCHKYFYQRRAEANRDVESKKKTWEVSASQFKPGEKPPMSREQIRDEKKTIQSKINDAHGVLETIKRNQELVKSSADRVLKYQEEIKKIEEQKIRLESIFVQEKSALEARIDMGKKMIDEEKLKGFMALPDPQPVRDNLNEYNGFLAKLEMLEKENEIYESIGKQKDMLLFMEAEFRKSKAFADGLDRIVSQLHGPIKTKVMGAHQMPIEGLQYIDGEFKLDGSSVDNLSSSKALKLAIGVARKLCKKTRLICIDGAEMLDEESYRALHEEIKDDGFTYFVTKVGEPFKQNDNVFKVEAGKFVAMQ